ncbi:MAG: hypothetical protein V4760_10320 [Bdellovibrionota bacterium]
MKVFALLAFFSVIFISQEAHVSGVVQASATSGFVFVQSGVGMKIPMRGHESAANKANDGRIAQSKKHLALAAKKIGDAIAKREVDGVDTKNLLAIQKGYSVFEAGSAGFEKFPTYAFDDIVSAGQAVNSPDDSAASIPVGKKGYVRFGSDPKVVLRFKSIPPMATLKTIDEKLRALSPEPLPY